MRAMRSGAVLLMLAGCVNPTYRDTVGQFGAITRAHVTAQDARLVALSADETERVRAGLAADHVDLRLSADCAQRLALQSVDSGTTAAAAPPPCRLVAVGGAAIEDAPAFTNIRALGVALSEYSDALIALAADTSQDRAAFADAVGGLATAIGGLDGAVRSVTHARPAASHEQLNAVAALVGKAGGLLLAAERVRMLKRIILAGDPVVQRAVGLLSDVDDRLGLYDLSGLALKLQAAQQTASRLAATGAPVEQLRPAQDELFAALADYNHAGTDQAHYAAIGVAHAKLAAAARKGASAAELQAAILAVLDLAAQTRAVVTTPRSDGGRK